MNGTKNIHVTPLVFPSVSILSDKGLNVCSGEQVTFTATPIHGGTAPSYAWTLNGTSTSVFRDTYHLKPTSGDVVAVSMTSDTACAASAVGSSVVMKVDAEIVPTLSLYSSSGTVLNKAQQDTFMAVISGGGSYTSYQWIKNGGMVTGATTSIFVAGTLTNGDSISCIATTGNACGVHQLNQSIVMRASNTAVPALSAVNNITIQPNPNRGTFVINGLLAGAKPGKQQVMLEITNLSGQVVYSSSVISTNGFIAASVQPDKNMGPGIYLLKLEHGDAKATFRMVVE